jgi:putative transposase
MSTQSIIRKQYPSDITDEQWEILKQYIPQSYSNKITGGRPEKHSRREIINAILYILSSGCRWQDIPHDLPGKSISWYYFNEWSTLGIWKHINIALRKKVRSIRERNELPSIAIIDSQSIKGTCFIEQTGYDAGKKIKGRKRHLLTDTQGLIIDVIVHSAGIQDRDGAKLLLKQAETELENIEKIYADGGYAGKLIEYVHNRHNTKLEIIKRTELHKFVVLPKRWIIERTNSWMTGVRRLARDYENTVRNQVSMIYVRMIQLMLRWVIG